MAKTYKTAQGRSLDIEKLRLQNELVPAIGNMRVNARGDQLGPGGRVVKSREEMVNEHYQSNISTKPKKHTAEADVIPTKGGKSKRVENFEPGNIQPDPLPESSAEKKELSTDENFENIEIETANPKPDPATGIAAGEKTIKGGLARAVAKTREYESKNNKPKRL